MPMSIVCCHREDKIISEEKVAVTNITRSFAFGLCPPCMLHCLFMTVQRSLVWHVACRNGKMRVWKRGPSCVRNGFVMLHRIAIS